MEPIKIWKFGGKPIPLHKFSCRGCMSGDMRTKAQVVEVIPIIDINGVTVGFKLEGYCRGHGINRSNWSKNQVLGPEALRKFYELKNIEYITNG